MAKPRKRMKQKVDAETARQAREDRRLGRSVYRVGNVRRQNESVLSASPRVVNSSVVDLDSFLTRGGLTVREVETRVLRACKTLRALPDNEWRYLRNGAPKSAHLPVVQDFMDAYDPDGEIKTRFRPTPFDVSDCLIALKWCNVLTRQDFKFIWWRSFDEVSYRMIGAYIGKSDETARARYRDAILRVWGRACIESPMS